MDACFETFILYYCMWREGDFGMTFDGDPTVEFGLRRMRTELLNELGREGFDKAMDGFRQNIAERKAAGIKKTLYEVLKDDNKI